MISITHAICAVAATSIFLGSDPALTLTDAEDLVITTHSDRFDTITGQPGEKTTIVQLESAGTAEATKLLTDYYATGSLIIRSQEVL